MANAAPDPKDVGEEFYFKQARKLQIEDNYQYSENTKSCLASSSRFGLIFVSFSKGIKVFSLKDLLSLNNSVQAQRTNAPLTEVPHQQIDLPNFPLHIALSCDDLSLAVCYTANDGCVCADVYDVRLFADQNNQHGPFCSLRLSNDPRVQLNDLSWNPSQCEVLATCMSNGTVTLYQVKEGSLEVCASSNQANASAICWSPKGKQLVAGKLDGCLVQYKLNLQIAKTIPAPTCFQKFHSVLNICWLSSFLFAAVYRSTGDNEISFVIVSTPKGGAVSYTNYSDILMCSAGQSSVPIFYMKHLAEWGMLITSSNIALETGVLGANNSDKTIWEQWILEDYGRAELPLTKHDESYAAGMSVSFCAQDELIINDQLTLPPMPVLLLISTSGVLCPFHSVNTNPALPRLTSPLETLRLDGIRKGRDVAIQPPAANTLPQQLKFDTGKAITCTPKLPGGFAKKNLMNCFNQLGNEQSVEPIKAPEDDKNSVNLQLTTSSEPIKPPPAQQPALMSNQIAFPKSETQNVVNATGKATESEATAFSQSAITKDSSPGPAAEIKSTAKESRKESLKPNRDSIIAAAIQEEINGFHNELISLKSRCSTLKLELGDVNEKTVLKEHIAETTKIVSNHEKTIKDFSNDVYNMKNMVLDTFCVTEEAKSINFRNKDRKYIHLLRSRGLDPIAKKNMSRLVKLYQYVDHQLYEVQKILDYQWSEHLEFKKQRSRKLNIPSAETIYKSLKTISEVTRLKKFDLTKMSQRLKGMRSEIDQSRYNSDYVSGYQHHIAADGELSKMADSLLNIQNDKTAASPRKKNLTPERQNQLRDILSRRKVTPVKCMKPENLSESKFLASFIQEDEEQEIEAAALPITSPKSSQMPANSQPKLSSKSASSEKPIAFNVSDLTNRKSAVTKVDGKNAPAGIVSLPSTSTPFTFKIDSAHSEISKPQFTEIKRLPPAAIQPVYEDITPPETPALCTPVSVSVNPPQSSVRNLFTGGSTSSAFSAPPKSIETPTGTLFGAVTKPKIEKPTDALEVKQTDSSTNLSSSTASAGMFKPNMSTAFSGIGSSLFPSVTSAEPTVSKLASNSFQPTAQTKISPKPSSSETTTPAEASTAKPFSFGVATSALAGNSSTPSDLTKKLGFNLPSSLDSSSTKPFNFSQTATSVETPSTTSKPSSFTASANTAIFSKAAVSTSKPIDFSALATTTQSTTNVVPATTSKPLNFSFASALTDQSANVKPFGATLLKTPDLTTPKTVTSTPLGSNISKPSDSTPSVTLTSTPNFSFAPPKAPDSTSSKPLSQNFHASSNLTTKTPDTSPPKVGSDNLSESSDVVTSSTSDPHPSKAFDLTPSGIGAQESKPFIPNVPTISSPSRITSESEILKDSTNSFGGVTITPVASAVTDTNKTVASSASATSFSFKLPEGQNFKPVLSTAAPTAPASSFTFALADNNKESATPEQKSLPESSVIEVSAVTGKVTTPLADLKHSVASLISPPEANSAVGTSASSFSFSLNQTSMAAATTTPTQAAAVSAPPTTSNVVTSPIFGGNTTFGAPAQSGSSSTPSIFGNSTSMGFGNSQTAASGFASTQTSSIFGNTPVSSTSSQSVFGASTQGTSIFGNSISAFGSTSGFGSPSAASGGETFGFVNSENKPGNMFGNTENSGGFFSGLGSKPSAEDANKNVFASPSFGSGNSGNTPTTNLFENTQSTGFGFTGSQTAGVFSSSQSGVGQTGFGGFGLGTSPQNQGNTFGGSATFGGSPSMPSGFGGSAQFGSSSAFGGSPSVFGGQSQTAFTNNASSAPTFGSVAAQGSNAPAFGAIAQQPAAPSFGSFSQQSPGFGSPAFGSNTSFESPAFGSAPSSNNTSFSQWRS